MLAELRTKSQITLPKDIVAALGLSEGDKLDVYEKDGIICMVPVTGLSQALCGRAARRDSAAQGGYCRRQAPRFRQH